MHSHPAQKFFTPYKHDVERYFKTGLTQHSPGEVGRVFNRAQTTEGMKKIIRDFCQKYVTDDLFEYDLPEFLILSQQKKVALESPFDSDGDFQPWVKQFLSPNIHRPLKKLIDKLWRLSSLIIHDRNGKLRRVWLDEFIGKRLLDEACEDEYFSETIIREQLTAGVMQCLMGEFGNVTHASSKNESDFRMIAMNIVTQQFWINLQCRDEIRKLKRSVETLQLKEGDSPKVKAVQAVIREGENLAEKLLKKPNQDTSPLARGLQAARNVIENRPDRQSVNKLAHIATEEVAGKPSFWKKFSGALISLVGVVIMGFGFYPGALITASGAALFYKGKQKGFSKSLTSLETISRKTQFQILK